MSTPLFGIVADDLTGACDTAARFTRRGYSAVCSIGTGFSSPAESAVIALNTRSRCMDAKQAAAAATEAVRSIRKFEPAWLFKKVDTALRGQIAAETLSIMESGFPAAVVVCAIPGIGRTTRGGRQFLHGVPIEQTWLGEDRLNPSPVTTSRIPDLFAYMPDLDVQSVTAFDIGITMDQPRREKRTVYICDAETDEDIDRIVDEVIRRNDGSCLFVGSLGLADALASALREKIPGTVALKPWNPVPVARNVLIVCGSSHPVARAQVEALARSGTISMIRIDAADIENMAETMLAPLLTAESSSEAGNDSTVCIHLDSDAAPGTDPEELCFAFASMAASAVERHGFDCLIVIGGETSHALCSRLGITTLDIRETFETVAAISVPGGNQPDSVRTIVTKGGSVGSEGILLELLAYLRKNVPDRKEIIP